jgi:excisionase family DNA binding protein
VLTVTEAAEELRVSDRLVRRLCRDGTLVAERHGGVWLIDGTSVTAYAGSRRAAV